jgi:hypothetical protein
MTSLGVYLLAWLGGVVAASVVFGCVAAASKSVRVRFISTVLIGMLFSSPFFGLFLKVVFEGTNLDFGPSLRHRGNEVVYAVLAVTVGAVILIVFIRVARSDRESATKRLQA